MKKTSRSINLFTNFLVGLCVFMSVFGVIFHIYFSIFYLRIGLSGQESLMFATVMSLPWGLIAGTMTFCEVWTTASNGRTM